ncbi:8468_t:CDS:2, partial [Ambispora leptoticha]
IAQELPFRDGSTKITAKQVRSLKDDIPQSSITKSTSDPTFPFSLNYFATTTSGKPSEISQIQAHSYHTHTCIICKLKDIPYAFLKDNKYMLLNKATLVLRGYPTHVA